MQLPKIQTPIYTTNLISNDKEITFRPLLVKEEKILLTALQEENNKITVDNFIQILKNCILTENIDVENMPSFDAIYLFIKIREKSMGEIINISVRDSQAKKQFDAEMNLNNIKIIKKKNIETKFDLSEDIGIILKYPTIKDVFNTAYTEDIVKTSDIIQILINCIDKIYDKNDVYEAKNYSKEELNEFIENLSAEMLKKITVFFNNIPKIIYQDEVESPYTNKKIKIVVENFIDFLI